MQKIFFATLLLFSGFVLAQVPYPVSNATPRTIGPEQRVLNFLADSLLRPALFKKACPGDAFHPEYKILVFDSTWHLPEPIMVYKFARPGLTHEEMIALTERQIINFGGREKLEFDVLGNKKVHFTRNCKGFQPGYYFLRISQPMLYEDYIYYDLWLKESHSLPGINILLRTDMNGMVNAWQVYTVCSPREK